MMIQNLLVAFGVLAYLRVSALSTSTDLLKEILQKGVETQVFPGAVGLVGNGDGILYATSVGHHEYSKSSPRTTVDDTIFDLASVSKVLGATQAVALLYQRGYLSLDTKIADILGPEYNNGGKEAVTVQHCLLHNAGFNPDPSPMYWQTDFGCPNSLTEEYVQEDFSCIERVYESLLNEELAAVPGERFLYSDLSFLTLQMVVGAVARDNSLVCLEDLTEQCHEGLTDMSSGGPAGEGLSHVCYYEAFVRLNVFNNGALPRAGLGYLPEKDLWPSAQPTINDTVYTHRRLQGQVSDGDCYAMGGICGHAGIFGSAPAVSGVLQYLVDAPSDGGLFLNASTVSLFTSIHDPTQSSRALGWDTNSYDRSVGDFGYHNSCGGFPQDAFMHIGYTGTCVCAERGGVWSVVLTNRVYNCNGQDCSGVPDLTERTEDVYRRFNTEAYRKFTTAD
jgi:serine-type D-Ala-D-Ala carboxypeptidase